MAELIILAGLPASGKSTWAKEYRDALTGKDKEYTYIISTDEIRKGLWGDESDQQNGKLVFDVAYQQIEFWLRVSYTDAVIFDATNLHRRNRKDLIKKFRPYADSIKLVWFDTPYIKCLERNSMRERHVPTEVIQRMFGRMDIPSIDEGYDEFEVVEA